MYSTADLRQEAHEALEKVWFVQSLEEVERTDLTIFLRLNIRSDLFVQAFYGAASDMLYLALIESGRRIFGLDRESGQWHLHPFSAPGEHKPLAEGLGPKPLLAFLAKVEDLLVQHDLL